MVDYRIVVYLADVIGMLLLVMVLIYSRRGWDFQSKSARLYYKAVVMNIILCTLDFPVFAFEGLQTEYTREILYFLNTVQAIILTAMTFVWLLYVTERAGTSMFRSKYGYLLSVPFFAVVVMYICNFFIPVVYRISDDFHYMPDGPLYLLVPGIDMCYFLGGSVYGVIAMRHSKDYQFFPFIMVLIITVAGCAVQLIDYRISVIYLTISIAFMAIFMESQNERSYIDPLSRVYNRQYLSKYAAKVCADFSPASRKSLVFLMSDVDNFKKINDTYGHQAGDEAIRDMGRMLLEAAPAGSVCARYGGDEFVVVLEVSDLSEVQAVTDSFNRMRRALNASGIRPYQLHVSFGSTKFIPRSDTPDDVFRRMDQALYEQKKARHARQRAVENA